MSAIAPIVLILGAGPNIGQAVARAFVAKGYKAALVSRKQKEEDSSSDQLNIAADLSNPDAIAGIFSKVKSVLGDHPSVVVHNAATVHPSPPTDPLSLAVADLTQSLNINTVSAFAAAQQAALGFAKLPSSASKTFIYTGNVLNTTVMPPLLDLGVGKSATAHIIQTAATAYKDQGFKFYYADQRKPDGSAIFNVDGEAHADFYVKLAEGQSQGPWQQAFVKGEGYKVFPSA